MAEEYAQKLGNEPSMADKYKSSLISQALPKEGSIPSYEDVNTRGMEYPRRDIMDVITGRGTSPEEAQQRVNQQYIEQNVVGSPEAIESVTPMADFFNPLAVPAKIAGGVALGYGATKGGKYLFDKAVPISSELSTAAKRIGISDDEALKLTKHLPKEDRAFELSKQGGGRVEGEMARALSGADDATRLKYADELGLRRQEVADAVGEGNFEDIKSATKLEFDTMRKAVVSESVDTTYNVSSLRDELDGLKTFARNDISENNINRMVKRIEGNPTQSLDDLLTLRQEINYELGKASGSGIKRFQTMKDNLDKFINESGIDDATLNIVDDAIDSYNRMKTQEEFIDILNSPDVTKVRAKGSRLGEQKAVNWGTLKDKLNKANLGNDVKDAVMISKKFSDKYGNVDGEIFSATRTTGQGGIAQTLSGDVQASAAVRLIQNVWEMLFHYAPTEKGATRRLQSAIRSSMAKGNSQREFAYEMIKNKNTPESIRAAMQRNLDAMGVRPDKIIDAERGKSLVKTPDTIDAEIIDPLKQIGGQAKKQLPFNLNGYKDNNMIPRTFDLQSDIIMGDKNFARPQTRDERIFNLKETTRPRPLTNSKGYKLPDYLNNNPFVEEALANGDINRANQVGLNRMETKGGLSRLPNGDEIYVNQINLPTDAIQTSLSSAAVKRIKKGQGTKDDFEALRIDAELLSMQEADTVF